MNRAIAVNVKDPEEVAKVIAEEPFDAALVVSNLSNVEVYHRRGLPVFFVDILYWYGARKDHAVWSIATSTYAQAFPGVRERIDALHVDSSSRPRIVGPLIRTPPPRSPAPRGTLVNLGGVRSRFIDPARAPMFLEWVSLILRELDSLLPPGPILVAAGHDALPVLHRCLPPRAKAQSLSQPEYLRALADASLLLTAPGLNAVFEGLEVGVPMAFLPPQNATQVLQLARYEDAGLLAPGLNLPSLVPALDLPERIDDEGAYTERVLGALRAALESEDIRGRAKSHSAAQVRSVEDREPERRRFREFLGPLGGPTVAADINDFGREKRA